MKNLKAFHKLNKIEKIIHEAIIKIMAKLFKD